MFDREPWRAMGAKPAPLPSKERSLMERLRSGDDSAFTELMQAYWAPLVAYADRLLSSRDAAEDVVQDTMLRVWERRAEWTPTDRLRSLLYRITRNLSLNERRRARVRNVHRALSADLEAWPPESPLELLERREIRDALAHALDALPARRREVFVLSRYHGHDYRGIAEIMDISPQTVANTMSAALDDLRSLLRPRLDAFLTRGQLRPRRRSWESRCGMRARHGAGPAPRSPHP